MCVGFHVVANSALQLLWLDRQVRGPCNVRTKGSVLSACFGCRPSTGWWVDAAPPVSKSAALLTIVKKTVPAKQGLLMPPTALPTVSLVGMTRRTVARILARTPERVLIGWYGSCV